MQCTRHVNKGEKPTPFGRRVLAPLAIKHCFPQWRLKQCTESFPVVACEVAKDGWCGSRLLSPPSTFLFLLFGKVHKLHFICFFNII